MSNSTEGLTTAGVDYRPQLMIDKCPWSTEIVYGDKTFVDAEKLKQENERLQKELEEMKALHPKSYMKTLPLERFMCLNKREIFDILFRYSRNCDAFISLNGNDYSSCYYIALAQAIYIDYQILAMNYVEVLYPSSDYGIFND